MGTVGPFGGDIFDEGHFFEHVFAFVFFVEPAVYDGEGQAGVVFEEDHDGHGKELVDFPGDLGELASGVFVLLEFQDKEEVGFDDGVVYFLS